MQDSESVNWLAAIVLMLLSALLGGVVGGGSVAAVSYRALKDKLIGDLSTVFARVSALRETTLKVDQMQTIAMNAQDLAAQNTEAITRLQESDRHWGALVKDSLDRLNTRLDDYARDHRDLQTQVTRTVALLDGLEQRFTRHLDGKAG